MIEITFSIPLGALYFGLFVAGLLVGGLGARWVYRPTPGRVRVPAWGPPVSPPPAGWQPSPGPQPAKPPPSRP